MVHTNIDVQVTHLIRPMPYWPIIRAAHTTGASETAAQESQVARPRAHLRERTLLRMRVESWKLMTIDKLMRKII